MELSPEGIVSYVTSLIDTMPSAIMQGDTFALTITLIAFFILVVIINQLTGLLIRFLKKVILFIIVALAFWQFIIMFSARVATEGFTTDTLVFGAAGFIIGFISLIISLYVALHSYYESQQEAKSSVSSPADEAVSGQPPVPSLMPDAPGSPLQSTGEVSTPSAPPAREPASPDKSVGSTLSAMKDSLSVSTLKSDKSLGAVLAYLVIAQFGVFSSKTMPAPSFQVGIAFFTLFLLAGLIFIHFTYNNYLTGLRHLFMAIIIGTIIALILGYFWGNIPLETLLSPAFFQTDALVALVTGLALSLFMGGKG